MVYLRGRKPRVLLDGVSSERCDVIRGVPKGSILGPLLLIVFVNDLPHAVEHSSVNLYADDTTIYADDRDPSTIGQKLTLDPVMNNSFEVCPLTVPKPSLGRKHYLGVLYLELRVISLQFSWRFAKCLRKGKELVRRLQILMSKLSVQFVKRPLKMSQFNGSIGGVQV